MCVAARVGGQAWPGPPSLDLIGDGASDAIKTASEKARPARDHRRIFDFRAQAGRTLAVECCETSTRLRSLNLYSYRPACVPPVGDALDDTGGPQSAPEVGAKGNFLGDGECRSSGSTCGVLPEPIAEAYPAWSSGHHAQ